MRVVLSHGNRGIVVAPPPTGAVRLACASPFAPRSAAFRRLLNVFYATDDPRRRVNVVAYLASPVAGELRAADDAAQARFVALDALPNDIAFANNRQIFARLRAEFPIGDIE